ncbi:MAG: hypothetical protein ACR5K2_01895 [Wolbachia sp.]
MRTFCIIFNGYVFQYSGLFKVKLHVQSLNEELKIKREISLAQSDIKVLQTEWSYLSNPKRLQNSWIGA